MPAPPHPLVNRAPHQASRLCFRSGPSPAVASGRRMRRHCRQPWPETHGRASFSAGPRWYRRARPGWALHRSAPPQRPARQQEQAPTGARRAPRAHSGSRPAPPRVGVRPRPPPRQARARARPRQRARQARRARPRPASRPPSSLPQSTCPGRSRAGPWPPWGSAAQSRVGLGARVLQPGALGRRCRHG